MKNSEPLTGLEPDVESALPEESTNYYIRRLDEYIERLRLSRRQVPESPKRKGWPHITKIALESGVPCNALRYPSVVRRRLDAAIAELGLSVFTRCADLEVITYQQLLAAGSEWREGELAGKPKAAQQLSNTRSALRQFLARMKVSTGRTLGLEDVIGPEFQEGFDESVSLVATALNNISSRRKFVTEIGRWQGYHQRLVLQIKLPLDFPSALKVVLERSGLSISRLAELAEGDVNVLKSWLLGQAAPSPLSFPFIERIEQVLGLAPKALTALVNTIRAKRFKLTDYPEFIMVNGECLAVRANVVMLANLRRLLPDDFVNRPEQERAEVIGWLYTNLIAPAITWRRSQQFATAPEAQFLLPELPPVVKAEWAELAAYKSSKLPPIGMKRSGTWSKATEGMRYDSLRGIMGALTLPAEATDVRTRGLGLPPDHLTIAAFTCPKLLHWRTRWMGQRRYENYRLGGGPAAASDEPPEKYSSRDASLIKDWASLMAPETGWLRQRPDLALNLRPLPGFIDEAFIARARSDWKAVCNEAFTYYASFAKAVESTTEELRDSFEPIMPILMSENPVAALKLFAQNILRDLPQDYAAPFRVATHMRNHLLVRLVTATALRSKNIRELTYRADNTGHLRREGAHWVIEIPYLNFKNWRSSFFGTKHKRKNYRKILTDADGLYHYIESYLRDHRPTLLKGTDSHILIVQSARKPLFGRSAFRTNYNKLTMYYLAYNPYRGTGIPGVLPHGPHSVRDIVATHIIKKTGSYDWAAYAIQDTAATTRKHYARFMPQDKAHLADQILDDGYLATF